MAEFVEAMDRWAIPPELPHMFLICCGALAVEERHGEVVEEGRVGRPELGIGNAQVENSPRLGHSFTAGLPPSIANFSAITILS